MRHILCFFGSTVLFHFNFSLSASKNVDIKLTKPNKIKPTDINAVTRDTVVSIYLTRQTESRQGRGVTDGRLFRTAVE